MKLGFIIFLSLFTGCTTFTRSVAQESNTKFYYGEVAISSADGKIPYGKTVSLVKRTVEPAKNQILEVVLQPPRDPQLKPKDNNTTLSRVGDSNVFLATDDEKSYEGEMTFEGAEWSWNSWKYDIRLKDRSKLNGTGRLDATGIKTQKTFISPDGAAYLLKEDLKSISTEEYETRHKQMMGN